MDRDEEETDCSLWLFVDIWLFALSCKQFWSDDEEEEAAEDVVFPAVEHKEGEQ